MTSAVIALIISLGVGGVLWYLTHRLDTEVKISTKEFLLGAAISTGILFCLGPLIEWAIIRDKTTYHEYFNGVEVAAINNRVVCERDGSCTYTYACDPYVVLVSYTTTDSEGNSTTSTRPETRYHYCPYLKAEHRYIVSTTLGDYDIGGAYQEPGDNKGWRDEPVPTDIPSGPPDFWLKAKTRIAAGRPGGVTKLHDYKNFLLASDKTILDTYSADIERYINQGLIPEHTKNYTDPIYDYYLARKFQAVRLTADQAAWDEALMRLNGFVGRDLQGDIHLLAVKSDVIKEPDRYAQSVFAYWKSPSLKKHAFPKNAVGVVVGVKDDKVVWARATGGLPVGNEGLFTDIQNRLVGVEFTPEKLVGFPKEPGALSAAMYGPHKFKRPCMECIEEQTDGYEYLKSDITLSGWQRFWIVFFGVIVSLGVWFGFLVADDRIKRSDYWRGY